MARQRIRTVSRLRRLARMLASEAGSMGDTSFADALVDEVLSGPGRHCTEPARLFALVVAAHRLQAGILERLPASGLQPGRATMARALTRGQADAQSMAQATAQAFAALPLAAREVLALVVVEELDYAAAAAVLGTTTEQVIARLEEGRRLLARRPEGERGTALRLVK